MQNDALVAPVTPDLTIAEMSHLYGVSLRTLRFYEEVGLIQPRRVGQHRFYSSKDSVRVRLILTGKRLGFSLRELGEMLQTHQSQATSEADGLLETLDRTTIARQLSALERQRADIDAAIAELTAMAQGRTRP